MALDIKVTPKCYFCHLGLSVIFVTPYNKELFKLRMNFKIITNVIIYVRDQNRHSLDSSISKVIELNAKEKSHSL